MNKDKGSGKDEFHKVEIILNAMRGSAQSIGFTIDNILENIPNKDVSSGDIYSLLKAYSNLFAKNILPTPGRGLCEERFYLKMPIYEAKKYIRTRAAA